MKRIRSRQRESAERRLNQGDRQFVIAHAPPASRICVMSDADSQKFHAVAIGHRCTSTAHRHYTAKHVNDLIRRGALAWVGMHHKIAAWTEERTWQKAPSGPVHTMQLLPGMAR